MSRDEFQQVARTVPFDNEMNDFMSEDVQSAIEELNNKVNTSASPGFGFGRSGNITSNTYLLCEGVPSNTSGRYVYINNAMITRVFVSVQLAATFTLAVYSHDGDELNLTLLGTVSVVNSTGGEFSVSWAVATSKQLAMIISTGSARNMVAGLELQGTNT